MATKFLTFFPWRGGVSVPSHQIWVERWLLWLTEYVGSIAVPDSHPELAPSTSWFLDQLHSEPEPPSKTSNCPIGKTVCRSHKTHTRKKIEMERERGWAEPSLLAGERSPLEPSRQDQLPAEPHQATPVNAWWSRKLTPPADREHSKMVFILSRQMWMHCYSTIQNWHLIPCSYLS